MSNNTIIVMALANFFQGRPPSSSPFIKGGLYPLSGSSSLVPWVLAATVERCIKPALFLPPQLMKSGGCGSVSELKIWDFFPSTSRPIFGFS